MQSGELGKLDANEMLLQCFFYNDRRFVFFTKTLMSHQSHWSIQHFVLLMKIRWLLWRALDSFRLKVVPSWWHLLRGSVVSGPILLFSSSLHLWRLMIYKWRVCCRHKFARPCLPRKLKTLLHCHSFCLGNNYINIIIIDD